MANATDAVSAVRGAMSSAGAGQNASLTQTVNNSTQLGNSTASSTAQEFMSEAAHNATQYLPQSDFGWGAYFQAVGAVFLILAIIMAGFWLLRRYGPAAGLGALGRSDLKFEGQVALGSKKSIAVVRFLNRRLVVGVTDTSINLLTEIRIDDANEMDFEDTLDADSGAGSAGDAGKNRGGRGKGGPS